MNRVNEDPSFPREIVFAVPSCDSRGRRVASAMHARRMLARRVSREAIARVSFSRFLEIPKDSSRLGVATWNNAIRDSRVDRLRSSRARESQLCKDHRMGRGCVDPAVGPSRLFGSRSSDVSQEASVSSRLGFLSGR